MNKREAAEACYDIRSCLALANKLYPCVPFEDALVKATRLIFYLRGRKKGDKTDVKELEVSLL